MIFFVTLYLVRNEYWFKVTNFFYSIEYQSVRKVLAFALITFFSVIASNSSLLYIRSFITETISIDAAGYWQGIWALSQIVLMFITTSLVTYFLPTISRLKLKKDISKELKRVVLFVMPIAIIASLGMYVLRDFIISILYTNDFSPMRELFLWQMIGNIIKVFGWVFGYVLVAKAMVKYTVSTEMIFASTFILLSMYCIDYYGLVGVTYAYAINNMLHAITMYYIYHYKLTEGL
jgi:PST family polysaccharide transporter